MMALPSHVLTALCPPWMLLHSPAHALLPSLLEKHVHPCPMQGRSEVGGVQLAVAAPRARPPAPAALALPSSGSSAGGAPGSGLHHPPAAAAAALQRRCFLPLSLSLFLSFFLSLFIPLFLSFGLFLSVTCCLSLLSLLCFLCAIAWLRQDGHLQSPPPPAPLGSPRLSPKSLTVLLSCWHSQAPIQRSINKKSSSTSPLPLS